MPRFCANLSMLFGDLPFLDRFEAARKAGFDGVEYLFPYDFDAGELREKLDRHRLVQVLHNLPAGNWAGGERGIAILPDRQEEFRNGVDKAIAYATTLGCTQVNCLAGKLTDGLDPALARTVLVENLRYAAKAFSQHGLKLLVEPINTIDIPGFFLTTSAQTLALLDEVGADNAFLQFDIYHMQIMQGDLARGLERHLARIAHVQIADNPGRHEPGTGEINYPFLFRHLDAIGYDGWVGCEYVPAGPDTAAGLGWLTQIK